MAASTATNSSTPACSPVLRKRSRSSTPQLSPEADSSMVEKGSSDQASPTTPEQQQSSQHQRTYSQSVHPTNTSTRSSGKNSKSHKRHTKKSQSWYNVLSPTYKQRNEDFRKLFKQLPDTERLIVDYSCALQRDILLQGRLYLSENWICFYSNIFRWETLLMVRLKDICSMTKEKTARLIPNAIQLCTDNEKHFLTSFGARDRTYMMMFRLWQNALLEKPLCPKELWHFVHQCYGNELGLTSDDEDYVPPDEDFNTMGYCEELPVEENNEHNDTSNTAKNTEAKPDVSPLLPHKVFPNNATLELPSADSSVPYDLPPVEDVPSPLPDADLLTLPMPENRSSQPSSHAPSPSLDLNDNEDLPTELSDSSETHNEGEVQAFHEDLSGRQYINGVYKFGVDKMYDLLFTESKFMRDFRAQRRFSDVVYHPWRKEQDGNQTREIMYTIALNNPLAPKTATVTETQTLYRASQENECYIIDAEVIAHDVPYHDYFYTLNRYMLTRAAKNKCRLRVSTELRYRKQPWGLVKGFIERNFWSGLDEYFRHLELELNKLDVVSVEPHRQSPKTKALRTGTSRRRKQTLRTPGNMDECLSPVTTPEDEEDIGCIKFVAGSTQTRHVPDAPGGLALYNFSKLLLLISLVLILLVVLNVMLFYKLWMLEYTTQSLTASHGLKPQEGTPQTQLEWVQLMDSQQRYHDDELQKWKEIIKSSVLLLDKLRESLLNLHKSIGVRDHNESEKRRNQYH
ncbi:protein Aster-B-like isoform X2 [Dicentrarchus labrax]|uniref:protein Aster-B-like isoform X2 n=1 Tax=Dicentrarchus labrax TaxID=13489 RepID=UPI0021F63999|nr:protein Aster-B-like isoform X2 [Dicentrarchus labrax]